MHFPPFVGDGERDTTGAAEAGARGTDIFNAPTLDMVSVRTRGDLADIINSAADPIAVKQEFTGPDVEEMDLDGCTDVEIISAFGGGDQSSDFDPDGEEDESLLEEQEEYAEHVVSCEGEEDDDSVHEDEEDGTAGGGAAVAAETAEGAEGGPDVGKNGGDAVAAADAEPAREEEDNGPGEGEEKVDDGADGGEDEDGQDGEEGEDGMDEGVDPEEIDTCNPNLRPDQCFFAVRSMLAGSMEPRSLNRKLKKPDPEPGFLVEDEERWYRNANSSCTKKKLNTSASFTPLGRCHTCLSGEHDAWEGREGQPVIVAAADQHFPANLPADGDGECIRILRVENGGRNRERADLGGAAERAETGYSCHAGCASTACSGECRILRGRMEEG